MISEKLQSQIRKLKIITKRLMKTNLAGDYLSAFKGLGMEFHQLREYSPGDDVRRIDWNSFVRTNKLMIKQFIEERDRTIILAIDISSSALYSSKSELRSEMISNLASVLALIASENKDSVGALFFSNKVEKWVPPSRKASGIGDILETLLTLEERLKKIDECKSTNINEALRFLVSLKKSNAIVFMLSDWIDEEKNYSKLLKVASCKHDFIAIRFLDDCERDIPKIGLIDLMDPESGNIITLNMKPKTFAKDDFEKKYLDVFLKTRLVKQKKLFDSYKIDLLDLKVGYPFINDLTKFFHMRIRRSI